jgi:CheY-like chemotaxis protein
MNNSLWSTMSELWVPPSPAPLAPAADVARGPARACLPLLPGSVTILLVEDDAMVREVMADALSELRHRLIVCADAEECLGALADLRGVAVLLTDVAMPGMSGVALADAFRQARPGSPVVFATGVADSKAAVGALGPADQLLVKPFGGAALLSAVAQAAALARDLSGRCSRGGRPREAPRALASLATSCQDAAGRERGACDTTGR